MKRILWMFGLLLAFTQVNLQAQDRVLVEAESFQNTGGWVIDQQSFDVLYSSYLMAHGMGRVVEDASTKVNFEKGGTYHMWVRTKDWAPYPTGPGAFKLSINGREIDQVFGQSGIIDWDWYYAGSVDMKKGENTLTAKDLSGFNGRFDAIYFSTSKEDKPINDNEKLLTLRKELLGLTDGLEEIGKFDLVVVGGGIAGTSAAISAARMGLKVALIQNRPVLGGNNSSEIRVHLMGRVDVNHYPKLGRIVRELDNGDPGNGNPDEKRYGDDRKEQIVKAEPNISLHLNTHVYEVEMDGNSIKAVIGRDIATNQEYRFEGTYFSDCTGDGTLGFLAGAGIPDGTGK